MNRDSLRPESWEEKIVAFADAACFVYSEAEREKELWEDISCLQKTGFPYWRDVFKKYDLGEYNKDHPFNQRYIEEQKTMIKYVKPEFFKDPQYQQLAIEMRKAQVEYGLKVPFEYEENL